MSEVGEPKALSVAIVTTSFNRRDLLEVLFDSLVNQIDHRFEWYVVDDASTDGTVEWLREVVASAPFPIRFSVNSENKGKAASLNRAFDAISADLSLVVDSDDRLLPDALCKVHEVINSRVDYRSIGAVFFAYKDEEGNLLGSPPGGRDLAMTRSEFDESYGKYDGCVGYTRTITSRYRYPEFENETYVGPTVLQLLAEPLLKVLFVPEVIGIAEYQQGGLTHSGRSLRARNPKGMMVYSKLLAELSTSRQKRAKYRLSYHAYGHLLESGSDSQQAPSPPRGGLRSIERVLGALIARRWQSTTRSVGT